MPTGRCYSSFFAYFTLFHVGIVISQCLCRMVSCPAGHSLNGQSSVDIENFGQNLLEKVSMSVVPVSFDRWRGSPGIPSVTSSTYSAILLPLSLQQNVLTRIFSWINYNSLWPVAISTQDLCTMSLEDPFFVVKE